MPNIKSAKKRMRSNAKKADVNTLITSSMKTAIKKFEKEVTDIKKSNDKKYAKKLAEIDKSISKTIQEESQKAGYDLVLSKGIVLYGGTDITSEITKAVK